MNLGEYLIKLLEAYGVDTIFGIPGVHTAEMYRGLASSPIRHIAPRHEQGAGFMADGYARVTGRPGVCLVITGPGLSNISTAMLQAKADSIPMLVISGVNARGDMGSGRGHLHEMPDQAAFATQCAVFSRTILTPQELPEAVARAFAVFEAGRPGPVHLEIPLDLMIAAADGLPPPERAAPLRPPVPAGMDAAAEAVRAASEPVILIGGGARWAGEAALRLAERLDCPLIGTINARASLPAGHPLVVPAGPEQPPVRALIDAADLVLAFGSELGPTDFDDWDTGESIAPRKLLRVDIDPEQLMRGPRAAIALAGDSGAAMEALLDLLGSGAETRGGAERTAKTLAAVRAGLSDAAKADIAVLDTIRDALPGVAIVGDSTQLVYSGNHGFEAGTEGAWFNAATGFGTLGYALPAALGAQLGAPDRPVVALTGDGGVQFVLGEFGTVADSGAPLITVLWNNRGYREIKKYMEDRQIAPEGVDLSPPDFAMIARAYGLEAAVLDGPDGLADALREARDGGKATLIEIRGV